MKILFVCLGNIYRSPTGHIIMQKIIADNNLNWRVDSCGTSSFHNGESPAIPMQKVAKKYGYDMSALKSRQITKQDLNDFDIIFAMDENHYNHIKKMGADKSKLKMFLELTPEYGINLPDPYYTNNEEQVFKICIDACNCWYQELIKRHC